MRRALGPFFLLGHLGFGSPALADAPAKHLFVLGGAGDPAGPTTIFDRDLQAAAESAQAAGWKTRGLLFNGGHETSAKRVPGYFGMTPAESSEFNPRTYSDWIASVERRLVAGEFKKGILFLFISIRMGGRRSQGRRLIRSPAGGQEPPGSVRSTTWGI